MNEIIIHTGAKGQRWGTRNYRNYDGTLTEEGRRRYDYYENKTDRVYQTARAKQAGPKTYQKTGRWGELKEDLSKYTNEELEALTKRARLEKDYREAFNTIQYTKGKKFINGFKATARETAEIASAGKALIDAFQGVRSSMDNVKEYQNKKNQKIQDEANKLIRKNNDTAVKNWILSIENNETRKNAQAFAKSFAGGKDYSNIDSEQLNKMKALFEKKNK
ncbi:MAG: hypothetical protein J6U54_15840 [Clostridiales bacterium]|nr:hypothetical protein [Clostridiales bacterium]